KFVYVLRRAISAYKKRQNCDPPRRIRKHIEGFPTEPNIIQYVLITKFYDRKFNTKLNRHFGTHIFTRHDIENYVGSVSIGDISRNILRGGAFRYFEFGSHASPAFRLAFDILLDILFYVVI